MGRHLLLHCTHFPTLHSLKKFGPILQKWLFVPIGYGIYRAFFKLPK